MGSAACPGAAALLVAVATLVALSSFHVGAAWVDKEAGSQSFHCMRPFSSLPRFSSSVMNAAENCNFGPLRVVSASARTRCTRDESSEGARADGNSNTIPPSCDVTVHVEFQWEGNGVGSVAARDVSAVDDSYRFALQIRALNSSVVHYKGIDQNGYSMCCSFLQGGKCSWGEEGQQDGVSHSVPAARSEPAVVSCPLHDSMPDGTVFRGVITKPLHRSLLGKWESRLEFWRGARESRELLGRLVVPFLLTEDDMAIPTGTETRERGKEAWSLVEADEADRNEL